MKKLQILILIKSYLATRWNQHDFYLWCLRVKDSDQTLEQFIDMLVVNYCCCGEPMNFLYSSSTKHKHVN